MADFHTAKVLGKNIYFLFCLAYCVVNKYTYLCGVLITHLNF